MAQAQIEGLSLQRHGRGTGTGYVGVRRRAGEGFQAYSNVDAGQKRMHLGRFLTVEGAALACAQEQARRDAATHTWVACDECNKWRIVPKHCVPGKKDRWYTARCPNPSPVPISLTLTPTPTQTLIPTLTATLNPNLT